MSDFIVSARKYRPATFASVVGQRHVTETLKNAIERSQLAHAYLLCGPRGVGKTTCARIFAKAINCMDPQGAEACNTCESCRSFTENRSLNIHELDAASNNSVEDIRSLIEQVRIMPQTGRYSVFIIDEVHMLSQAAFNAFLKTLEEPPAHAIFILATTEKHKIIPTILSRCQVYDFNRIRVEDAVEYLKYIATEEGVTVDDESLNLIAQKADGGMRDALSMFDKAVSFCGSTLQYQQVAQTLNVLDYDTYFHITDLLSEGDYVQALLAFDEVLGRGFSGQTFMSGLNRHFRDLLVARDPATLPLLEFTGSLTEKYRAQATKTPMEFLFGAIALLTDADGKIRQSSNQRLLVELGLMKIAGLGQKKNNPDGITEESYSLPPLVTEKFETPAVEPATSETKETSAPAEKPVGAVRAVASVDAPRVSECADAAPSETPATTPVSKSEPRKTLGLSLSALVNEPVAEVKSESVAAEPTFDPDSERKLTLTRDEILALIHEKRPRFEASFEEMTFEGHVIRITVPSQSLQEEILRQKTEMLHRFAQIADIHGMLDLEVSINEAITSSKPIKPEDKMQYLTDKNPLLTDLRQALDLEIE